MFVLPPEDHVAPGISVIVSLKAFAVELKNNCPSTCWLNTAGASHSSVAVVILGAAHPDANAEALPVPAPLYISVLEVAKSATYVQLVPSHDSVVA